ncbi:heme-binding beta-barrel domain-containing protein, partial [Rhodococcus erythropolis]|nr:heme-binding beta-barrel domain-containing protein [Rhodococcus erythropolis]
MSSTDQAALSGAGIDRFTGRWVGAGAGHFPTIDDFEYSEEIEFAPTPKPFVTYSSRTR